MARRIGGGKNAAYLLFTTGTFLSGRVWFKGQCAFFSPNPDSRTQLMKRNQNSFTAGSMHDFAYWLLLSMEAKVTDTRCQV